MTDTIEITAPADFHVHLRQGTFSELVTKHVREGGFTLAYVMVCFTAITIRLRELTKYRPQPNLQPPIKTTEEALLYKAQLQAIDPSVEYLMTLYLSPELTPNEIRTQHTDRQRVMHEAAPNSRTTKSGRCPVRRHPCPELDQVSCANFASRVVEVLRRVFMQRAYR